MVDVNQLLQQQTAAPEAQGSNNMDEIIRLLEERLQKPDTEGPTVPLSIPKDPEAETKDYMQQLSTNQFPGRQLPKLQTLDPATGKVPKESGPIFGRAMQRMFGTDVEDPLPWTRTGTTLAGAVGGGVAGSQIPGPPVVKALGGIAGGMVGTVAGAVAPEATIEGLEQIGLLQPGTRERIGLSDEDLKTVLEGEALLDMYTFGGVSLARLGGRGVTGILTGATPATRRMAETATREGIALLPVQVGEGRFARGFVSVMGRFPWIAAGLKGRAERSMRQIEGAFQGIPARLGPTSTFDEVSGRILREASGLAQHMDAHYTQQFDELMNQAAASRVTIRPVRTRSVTDRLMKQIEAQTPKGYAEPGMPAPRMRTTKGVSDFRRFLSETGRMLYDGNEIVDMPFRQMDQIVQRIDERMTKVAESGDTLQMRRLDALRTAVLGDMATNATGPRAADFGQRFRQLDEEMTNTLNTLFNTAAAKRAGAIRSPNMRAVRFGDVTQKGIDGLAQVMMRGDSPAIIQELGRIVEPETMQRLANSVFTDAIQRSFVTAGENAQRFDVDAFARNIGLNAPQSSRYRQMQTLLEQSGGMSMQDIGQLVEVGRRASGAEIPDVSTFVARRATMGGIRTLVHTLLPFAIVGGAGYSGGVMTGLTVMGGGRLFAKMISDPKSARALRRVADLEARNTVKNAATIRAVTSAASELTREGLMPSEDADAIIGNIQTFLHDLDEEVQKEHTR